MTDTAPLTKDQLLHNLGRALLSEPTLAQGGWRGVSVIVTFQPGAKSEQFFLYPEESETGEAWRPGSLSLLGDIPDDLRTVMAAETGKPWVQMLYQIWMPGPDFAATFEYDRADRWARTSFSIEGIQALANAADPRSK